MKQIEISDNDSGQRLDKYLLKYFNKATKSFIYKMLRKKRIKLNGGKAEGKEMLSDGDTDVPFGGNNGVLYGGKKRF